VIAFRCSRVTRGQESAQRAETVLLDRDGGAGGLEGLGSLLGGLLRDLLEDRLRGAVDEVLGLLEAQGGELAHDLDDLDLLVAGTLEDDVELVLLGLGLGGSATKAFTNSESSMRVISSNWARRSS
jgi:hypothetical protein